ncbi:MAG: NAD-dependent epimerase/dehydratase family protein [bacterium]
MTTVLVTCVGSDVGQSVVDSLVLSGGFNIVGCDMSEDVYAYNYCHRFYTVPEVNSGKYLDKIVDIARQEKADIVIPGHDHELLIFAKQRDKFLEFGIEVVVSSPDIIMISRDKYKWYEYFSKLGCSIVPTMKVDEFRNHPENDFFPAIVKSSSGSASKGISILKSAEELNSVEEQDLIQPYLFPVKEDENYNAITRAVEQRIFVQFSEISIQIVFSKNSEVSGIFISKNTLKSGVPVTMVPIPFDEFEYKEDIHHFVNILKKKRVKGPVNLRGIITTNGFYFFEMNMRFTGLTGNRAKTGFNEVTFLVKNFLDLTGKLQNHAPNKMGIRQVACSTKPINEVNLVRRKVYTILGGGGYIGSYFLKELLSKGDYEAINLIVREVSFFKYKKRFASERAVHVVKENDPHIQDIYCMTDVLINFASALANMQSTDTFKAILFQYEQIKKISEAYIPLVINISSQSVYNQKLDIKKSEDADLDINSLYSFQKYIGELFFSSIHEKYPALRTYNLRFSRVIGPSSTGEVKGFFTRVISNVIHSETTPIPNPNNKINLLDIRDAVSAIFFLIKYDKRGIESNIFNIGGTNVSLKEYCNSVLSALDMEDKTNLFKYSSSEEITETSMIDSSLANSYGWQQQFSIEDTILNIALHIK